MKEKINLFAIGGYSEVGKNMTALQLGSDVIILDAGLYLPAIVEMEEAEREMSEKRLRAIKALPNDYLLDHEGLRKNVIAIASTHAHLDHIGAIPYLAHRYNAQILSTPFSIEVLKTILHDENIRINNPIKAVQPNSQYIVKGKNGNEHVIEFINITHSTPQTAMIAIHTEQGAILYANDFKFDNSPIVGKKPNYARLKQLAQEGILALVVDSLYAGEERKTPSEKIARDMLEDVLLGTSNENSGIIVTTFSSHIARLKSICDCAKQLNRKPLFIGRSLRRYLHAASRARLAPFTQNLSLLTYRKQIEKALKKVSKARSKYLLVVTGHQGEPHSVLDRLSRDALPFTFSKADHVIFSSKTIPTPVNIENRRQLDKRLKQKGVRIFSDIHTSVLPDTQVVVNQKDGIEIKEIKDVGKKIKTPAFDNNLKIKWFEAELVKHPYNGKIFTIETKSGRKVDITSGHSLFILENSQVKEVKGDNLKKGDYIAIPKQFSWYKELKEINMKKFIDFSKSKAARYKEDKKWIYYANKKICKKRIKLSKNFARLLGYYLAEGSAPRHLSLVFNANEKDLIEEVKRAVKDKFPCPISISKSPLKEQSIELTFGARILGRVFKKWFGENVRTKKIPSFIFSTNKEFKLNFLGAYIAGDGSIDKKNNRIRIKTASKKLASDLLYLFTQVGICAKFDNIEKIPSRQIGNNKKFSKESFSYIIRIQGRDSLAKIYNYLSPKFKSELFDFLFRKHRKPYLTMPPEALPLSKLDLTEITPKKGTDFDYTLRHLTKKHIHPRIILRDSRKLGPAISKIINSDLLFDPVIKIITKSYSGNVYDLKVPGAENFIGGFGGVILHNSGHCAREDLRDLIEMLQPLHVIPAHGDATKLAALAELSKELGYSKKDCHVLQDGQKLTL